jgi:hypothetical protein
MNSTLKQLLFACVSTLPFFNLSLAQDKPSGAVSTTVADAPVKPIAPSATQAPKRVLNHKSSFDNYRPYSDEKAANWKAANDEVGRIGGWRAYLKEAQEPEVETSPKPKNPHAGHGPK